MIRINLLPHREQKRLARRRQFSVFAGATAVAGLVTAFLVHSIIGGAIDRQNARNQYLESEIARLDKQIEEIKKLKELTQAMLARKQVVESLQSNRSQSVHLLDQLVRQLPDGVYLKSIKQTGNTVALQGYAQSNARVATLMRNLEASPWLATPELIETRAATVNNLNVSEFSLRVKLTPPGPSGEQQPGAGITSKGGKA
jgi:type IV pilus assembly protein PilN